MHTTRAVVAAAGLALLAAACGGSPHVGAATGSTTLDFSRCMRAHGVASFPDPTAGGALPKQQVAELANDDLHFVAAHRACEHLLPNGGRPTPAQVQQAWSDMRKFARCMRSQGFPDWPDPTVTSPQDNRPFFDVPASIDPTAPQVVAENRACEHVMHSSNPLVTTQ